MHDGSLPNVKYKDSKRHGLLIVGDCFVQRDYEPADLETELYVECLRDQIDIEAKRPTSHLKIIRCLSDFLVAAKTSATGYVCWIGKDCDYVRAPYGGEIARKVRAQLIAYGFLEEVQKSSQADELARIYKVHQAIVCKTLDFKCHGMGPEVIVRKSSKLKRGKKVRGNNIPRKKFIPEILPLEAQVRTINAGMLAHPLEDLNEQNHARCYRVFNDGSLTVGGRLYGGFQQYSEEERLLSLIDGEVVCEIDFKASYLSIINILLGDCESLGDDPYQRIPFVFEQNDHDAQVRMRKLAKRLVAAYVGRVNKRDVTSPEVTKFPAGKRGRDTQTGEVRTISIREEFGLPRDHGVRHYMADIFDTYSFMYSLCDCPENVMFRESQILVGAIEALAKKDVPAYPVHDCLIVKHSDCETAIRQLQICQIEQLGRMLPMDLSYHQQEGEIITRSVPMPEDLKRREKPLNRPTLTKKYTHLRYTWGEEDCEVIEDID